MKAHESVILKNRVNGQINRKRQFINFIMFLHYRKEMIKRVGKPS